MPPDPRQVAASKCHTSLLYILCVLLASLLLSDQQLIALETTQMDKQMSNKKLLILERYLQKICKILKTRECVCVYV